MPKLSKKTSEKGNARNYTPRAVLAVLRAKTAFVDKFLIFKIT